MAFHREGVIQMPKFMDYDYSQNTIVVVNFEDQLHPGTFEHTIHHLIDDRLDLTVFYPKYKNDEGGRPAYDPSILLKIVLFAYSKGITSSRVIQWNCETNILFKALSCDSVPHFTTIANFVSDHPKEIEALFEQILLICDQQGLLGKELFAIDGCKMSSDAAKEWSGTHKELKAKRDKIRRRIHQHLKEHQRNDQDGTLEEHREKRLQQTLESLEQACEKIDAFLKSTRPRMGQGKRPKEVKSNITDNESCKMTTSKGTIQGYTGVATVDKKHQIIVDAQAFGVGQENHLLQPVLETLQTRLQRLNISDDIFEDGTIVTADTGYANEQNNRYLYNHNINGYVPDNKFRERDPKFADQKKNHRKNPGLSSPQSKQFSASDFHFNARKKTCRCPAGESLWLKGERDDEHGNTKVYFEGRLSKCRVCHLSHFCMRNPTSANDRQGNGRQVSFILSSKKKEPPYTQWMKKRVDSQRGKDIYSHRMSVVEPVFANIGTNKKLNRFSLRSKEKVQGQWQLYCLIHNIEKLTKYGNLTPR